MGNEHCDFNMDDFKHEKEGNDIMTLLDLCKVYFGSHDMMKYDKHDSFKLFFGTCFSC